MNKANECTCPSGDGSLVHPCPAHPAVEQAGGDERAAFEVWASALGWKLSPDQNNCGIVVAERYGHPGVQRCWEAWQARAALAQPSPAHELDPLNLAPHAEAFNEAPDEAIRPEQAEAERPEVVAYFDRNYPSTGDAFIWSNYEGSPYEPVMTVAQHDRIVGALRADAQRWREQFDCMQLQRNHHRDRANAALARVAELEHSQSFQRDIDYSVLSEYADKHRLHFNNLCAVVRSALIALPAQAQHSMPEGYRLIRLEHFAAIKAKLDPEQVDAYRGRNIYDEDKVYANWNKCRSALDEIKDVFQQIDWDTENELAELLAAAPVCRLSRSALTDAQMRRLYENSTETENERLGFEAFARLIRRAEAVHQITAAPGKEVGHE
ncbi:hypothetical protein GHU20_07185 [Pseudomonas aeruginosa]|nr:hypothetical protein [Pseudomonas aeruginosa]